MNVNGIMQKDDADLRGYMHLGAAIVVSAWNDYIKALKKQRMFRAPHTAVTERHLTDLWKRTEEAVLRLQDFAEATPQQVDREVLKRVETVSRKADDAVESVERFLDGELYPLCTTVRPAVFRAEAQKRVEKWATGRKRA